MWNNWSSSYTTDRNVYGTLWKTGDFLKISLDTYTYDLAISPLGITQKKWKYISIQTDMNAHSSFVFNNQNLETIQITINR